MQQTKKVALKGQSMEKLMLVNAFSVVDINTHVQ